MNDRTDNKAPRVTDLELIDAAGAAAARLRLAPTAGTTTDAIEEFGDLARRYRIDRGDEEADRLLGLIDKCGLIPRYASFPVS